MVWWKTIDLYPSRGCVNYEDKEKEKKATLVHTKINILAPIDFIIYSSQVFFQYVIRICISSSIGMSKIISWFASILGNRIFSSLNELKFKLLETFNLRWISDCQVNFQSFCVKLVFSSYLRLVPVWEIPHGWPLFILHRLTLFARLKWQYFYINLCQLIAFCLWK